MDTIRSKFSAGRLILSVVAAFTVVSPYVFDWNSTHIFNTAWPPHAKFHNAQTMVLGAMLGLISIYCLWWRTRVEQRQSLNEATCLVSLYWLSQFPAILFPGTMLTDPDGAGLHPPLIFGLVELNQLTMDLLIIFPLIALGYILEMKKLRRSAN